MDTTLPTPVEEDTGMEGFLLLASGPKPFMHTPSTGGGDGGCEVPGAMACSNILSVPLREMTEETGLAVKDGEAKKYVSAEGPKETPVVESHQQWLLPSYMKIYFRWL